MSKKIQKVISVTTSITTILWLSGVATLAPMAAMATTIVEGDTIKTANNPDVYIAKYVGTKMFKRLILNPDVFNSYRHLSWSKIKTVSQSEMDAFTTSDLVKADGDYKVYKLIPNGDVGSKQWVNMSAEAFTAGGYDWSAIYTINSVDRENYTVGTDITGGTSASPSVSPSTSPVAGALSVALSSDTPVAGVAVGGAARIPFTKVSLTAGSDAVTVSGMTVQRTGLADDAAISSLVIIDQDGMQVGLSQTLNSSHQAVFTDSAITIPANTTKTYVLAANMPAVATAALYAGQLASLSLVAVNTTASVSAALPITGNAQTINGTLVIGTATITTGSLDPGTAATKNVGTTNYNFSAVKITAGSSEDTTVYSIKWNQAGSAASSDLANMRVSDGTTDYAASISTDGKYYTASFGTAGVVIGKGLNKEFTIKGDILNGSTRTVFFDIFRNTDIVVKGNTYNYYMTPTFTANGVTHATANATAIVAAASPYFAGAHVTIGGGSLRIDKSATGAPAANITRGATGQLLGAFDFVVQGEPVNVASIRVDFDHTGVGSTTDFSTVTLNKADGTVLSTGGTPGDDTTAHATTLDGTLDGHVSFSGTVTFPVGTTQVLVKGNMNTDFVADNTFRVGMVTPDVRVTSITGGTTGNTVTATPATAIWTNTMTVKGGSLSVTVSGTPVDQTVIRGATSYVFSNYLFDASASGEDVRVTTVILRNAYSTATDVASMVLYDGTTPLNTTAVTPVTTGSPGENTFTLDTPLVIAKGTQKTVALKGNVSPSADAAHTQRWGVTAGTTEVTATGVSTGQAVTVTTTTQTGQLMTIAANGQYSVALDASTPAAKLVAANTIGNTMTVLRMKATAEQITITKMRLSLTSGSSTANDLALVYVYDGSTLLNTGGSTLGTGNATGNTANASSTITFSTPLVIAANQEKQITIKADINPITPDSTIATSGHGIAVNFYGATDTSENAATGASGASIANYSVTTAAPLTRIHRSVPTLTVIDLPTTKLGDGTKVLSKFSVKADPKGDIDLYKFTFTIATTTAGLAISNLTLVDTTDSSEVIVYASTTNFYKAAQGTEGIAEFVLLASPGTPGGTITPRTIAAGATRTFELRGTVAGSTTSSQISTVIMGDTARDLASGTYMDVAATVNGWTNNDFIWSDWSVASHSTGAAAAADWTNGQLVNGLPSSQTGSQILSY